MKVRRKDELFRALRESVPGLAEEVDAAMEAGATEMVSKAKQFAPFDDGDLRDSIDWTRGRFQAENANVRGVRGGGDENSIAVHAGNAKAYYAAFVEFGTPPRPQGGMFKGTHHPGTRAQPFFFVAYRLLRKGMKGRVSRAMTRAMKRAGLKR